MLVTLVDVHTHTHTLTDTTLLTPSLAHTHTHTLTDSTLLNYHNYLRLLKALMLNFVTD